MSQKEDFQCLGPEGVMFPHHVCAFRKQIAFKTSYDITNCPVAEFVFRLKI